MRVAVGRPVEVRGAGLLRAVALVLLGLATVVAGLVLPAGPGYADDGDLVVEITDVAPAVLRPGEDMQITGRITNTTSETLRAPTVRLHIQPTVPSSREAVQGWLDGLTDPYTYVQGLTSLEDPLEPGATASFALELPAEANGFSPSSAWGPRGIELSATSGTSTGSARTALLWYPDQSPLTSPAELSVLVPLTPTAQEWRDAVDDDVPVGQVAADRLLAVLDAVDGGASLAVDPVLLEGVVEVAADGSPAADGTGGGDGSTTDAPTGDDATDAPTGDDATDAGDGAGAGGSGAAGGEAADRHADLVDRLARASTAVDVIPLPYADADLEPLAERDAGVLWDAGVERGATVFARAGISVLPDVEWPAGTISDVGLGLLADLGAQAVVVSGDEIAADEATDARAVIDSPSGTLDALVGDTELGSALLDPGSAVLGRQRVLALAALPTRADGDSPGSLLAVLPRDVTAASLDGVGDRLAALSDAPWLRDANLRSLLGRTDAGAVRLDLPTAPAVPGSLGAAAIGDLVEAQGRLAAFVDATGPGLDDAHRPGLLSPLARVLTTVPDVRDTLLERAATAEAELAGSITVEPGSDILLVSQSGAIPITIRNDLTLPATVEVSLRPDDDRLRVDAVERVELPASGATTVRVPVTAQVASGNVVVGVHVRAGADGVDLAQPASVAMRLRADWENTGTAILAGLLAIAFVLGLVRTIRRGGRRREARS